LKECTKEIQTNEAKCSQEFMIKLAFGERTKFLCKRPKTSESLRLECGKAFGMIGSEVRIRKEALREKVDNPEEGGGEE
jgi:hypothetical protein